MRLVPRRSLQSEAKEVEDATDNSDTGDTQVDHTKNV